jgi:hypothetical protein
MIAFGHCGQPRPRNQLIKKINYIGFSSKYRASIRLISLMEFLAQAKRFSSISSSDKCQSILSVAIYLLG